MKKIYTILILISYVLINSSQAQCSLYPVSLSSRVNNSGLIIEGKVISQKSFWNASRNYIYSSNLIQVNQVLKGSLVSPYIEIITEGGEVDMNKQLVEPSLQLTPSEEGVFMLNSFNQPAQFGYSVFQTYADQQGFIKFNLETHSAFDPFNKYIDINNVLYTQLRALLHATFPDYTHSSSQNKFVSSSSSIASISGISPTTITAGTSSTLTITGAGFGATQGSSFVQFKNADDGGATNIQPHSSQYVSWSNTQIQVLVPTKASTVCGTAGTGQVTVSVAGSPTVSAQTLVIDYGEINAYYSNTLTPQQVFNTRHVGLNGMNGITWQMYTGFDANTAAKNSFLRAFQTWRCNTNINWVIGLPVSTNTIAADGVDVIRFDIGSELPVGVLGRCTSYFNGCTLGSNVYFFVSELDICFDDATNWQLGPALATGAQYDFESVTVHELGHGHQLSHVINNSDVMHYSIASAVNKRSLITQNINAGNDVMTRDVISVCGQQALVPLAAGTCTVTAPTASFNIASSNVCVGQSVALTNTTTGSASNYSWTITGGTPATSSLVSPSTVYGGAGIYSVTLLASNGVGTSSQTKTINVVAIPTVAVTSNSICSGNSTTLTASGASSYTWNPGSLTGASQVLNPSGTTIYNVIGSNGTCTNTASGTVTVVTTPTVSVPNAAICVGSSTLITASGATNYTWTPGALNGSSQTLNPSSNTSYTVKGANATCTNSTTFSIAVNNNPTVTANSSSSVVCTGQSVTLTASGALSYTFNPMGSTTNPATDSPTTTTTYTINGTDANGCSNTTLLTQSVSLCTGLSSLNGIDNFASIFPNPTTGNITINFNKNYTGDVTVINALGQLILTKVIEGKESTAIDLTNYTTGIYVIKFYSDKNETSFIKVVRD